MFLAKLNIRILSSIYGQGVQQATTTETSFKTPSFAKPLDEFCLYTFEVGREKQK